MLKYLKDKNPDLAFFDVDSEEFGSYGRIIKNLDTAIIVEQAEQILNPPSGSTYVPEVESFMKLPTATQICDRYFGTMPTQIGYCWGRNNKLNATEWHTSSEINIAATPLVLILGHVWELEDGRIDSSAFRAFYLPKGTAVEIYATTLHFTPCEVCPEGFGCVVALPKGTNTELQVPPEDKKLFRKNKWIVCHEKNNTLLERGVVPGITGINHEIKY